MAFVPEDARAEIDREDLEAGDADVALSTVEVPEDVKADMDADTRARAETPGDDGRRVAPLQEIDEKYRG